MSQQTIFRNKGSFLKKFLHLRPLNGRKLKSQGQKLEKNSLRQFKAKLSLVYWPKILIGSNQGWSLNLNQFAMGEHGFFLQNLIFSVKMQGCSLVHSDPLKVFSLRHNDFGNFHFSGTQKLAKIENSPKIHQKII